MLSAQINTRWSSSGHKLPEHLDELSGVALADPVTRAAYEYHVKEGSQYELCATFALDGRQNNEATLGASKWSHPAGRHCFLLDASVPADNPNIYFPD